MNEFACVFRRCDLEIISTVRQPLPFVSDVDMSSLFPYIPRVRALLRIIMSVFGGVNKDFGGERSHGRFTGILIRK